MIGHAGVFEVCRVDTDVVGAFDQETVGQCDGAGGVIVGDRANSLPVPDCAVLRVGEDHLESLTSLGDQVTQHGDADGLADLAG